MMDAWYFAYGSNLDPGRKETRTGPIREARRARLPGYRLNFEKRAGDGSGYANIAPFPTGEVWGIVYLCSPEAFRQMDIHEGVPNHYRRDQVKVILEEGEALKAVAYVAQAAQVEEGLRPRHDYLDRILTGARHHNLPRSYINELEGWDEQRS